MPRVRALILRACTVWLGCAWTLLAQAQTGAQQPPRDALAAAEGAYMSVDFETTLRFARQALDQGGHSTADLVRIYELVGISSATLGDLDAAEQSFLRMLALNPSAELTSNLAPRLRSPFLEARGFWSARSTTLGAQVSLSPGALTVTLSDPLHMARQLVVRARPSGEGEFVEQRKDAADRVTFNMDELHGVTFVEYTLLALDEHGNHVIEIGSEERAATLGEPHSDDGTRRPVDDDGGILSSPVFWIVTGAVVLGGLGIGAYFVFYEPPFGAQTSVAIGG